MVKISTAQQVGSGDMIDITGPEEEVEVLYRDGVLWVNIDPVQLASFRFPTVGICPYCVFHAERTGLKGDPQ